MPGNCKFNDNLLVKAAYKSWLKRSSNVDKAFCTVCGKDFSISAMGESAVSTHAKGKKHVDRLDMVCVNSIANYTKKINDS